MSDLSKRIPVREQDGKVRATNYEEVSFGYTFPRKMLGDICDIKVSLVGRNLWMIYNKAPFDPEGVASTDNFYQGIDYFMMPSLRNIGFSLSFKFYK